jgi:hypothetical protein
LKLEVYSEDGEEPLSSSDESTAERPGEGALLQVEEDGRLLLRITGDEEATNFYLLNIKEAKGDGGKDDQQNKEKNEDEQQDDKEKQDQDKQEQDKQEPEQEEQQKPIEQMMDQLDQEKRPNLEAERMLRKMPNVQAPGGKVW